MSLLTVTATVTVILRAVEPQHRLAGAGRGCDGRHRSDGTRGSAVCEPTSHSLEHMLQRHQGDDDRDCCCMCVSRGLTVVFIRATVTVMWTVLYVFACDCCSRVMYLL